MEIFSCFANFTKVYYIVMMRPKVSLVFEEHFGEKGVNVRRGSMETSPESASSDKAG